MFAPGTDPESTTDAPSALYLCNVTSSCTQYRWAGNCELLWRRWPKGNRQNNAISYPTTTADTPPITPYRYDPIEPPTPNPYAQVFPENRSRADSSAFPGPGIVPDHQRGQTRRSQPNLQHAPAHNPYSIPTSSRTSRSQPNLSHALGQNPYGFPMSSQTGPSRSDLQHPPAQNPYASPIVSQSTMPSPPSGPWNHGRWQGMSVSPPPSYATEDGRRGA